LVVLVGLAIGTGGTIWPVGHIGSDQSGEGARHGAEMRLRDRLWVVVRGERFDDAHCELRGGEDAWVAGNDGLERTGIREAREDRELHDIVALVGLELDGL
jgi:hypothetical protein